MANKMPPELLEKFKKMSGKEEKKTDEKSSDKNDARKRALAKARKAKKMSSK
jgi:hypothetical protein